MPSYREVLEGRHVGVWGFGREGRAVAAAAVAAGASAVTVVDAKAGPDTSLDETVCLLVGDEYLDRLTTCDIVFVSPGIPWLHPVLRSLRSSQVAVTSATDLFLSSEWSRTIGITGTKGKSTTATFLAHVLTRLGSQADLAGNIGVPLLDVPDSDRFVVAEVSSQQCAVINRSPRVAVVTNLGEDHLDWHGDVHEYHRAKARLFDAGAAVLVCESAALDTLRRIDGPPLAFPEVIVTEEAVVDRWPTSESISPYSPFQHRHNRRNGQLAVLAAESVLGRRLSTDEIRDAIETFAALPHRLERVREAGGRVWIDDTLATTADSVVAALSAMPDDAEVALIVGGLDRGISYELLDEYLLSEARKVELIQIPSNGAKIGEKFAAQFPSRVHPVSDLEAAVQFAAQADVDVVLLSPGAPSYDAYANYEQKSAEYVAAIDSLR
ncbi:UDP-N-acetylmuramoyl-L-alanine--D-glutamate ligase [Gordonia sp. (in: high G+C Gram-positive bacteria)]|uniref:UDP-N-acetylmuramoyl-L-alanine--D-glutamate ligase n=1 Tax=Gordonia sp. (in: high G+C Gram-positive bacteria) TaxID=84139 RepID=UPI003C71D089